MIIIFVSGFVRSNHENSTHIVKRQTVCYFMGMVEGDTPVKLNESHSSRVRSSSSSFEHLFSYMTII